MAYIAASAIQTRVREVLQEAAGALRTITAATFGGDLTEGVGDAELARRGVTIARIEAREVGMSRSASSPPVIGNLALYDSEWSIKVVRTLDRTTQIDDDTRDAVKALAMKDGDVVAQALGFPGNLTTTTAGTATGIVSGLMTYVSSSSAVRGGVNDGASIIETDHRFTAILRAAPATS
jgi:hypothetical protein